MSLVLSTIQTFYDLLATGEVEKLTAIFKDEPIINSPMHGEVRGKAAFAEFVISQQKWLIDLQYRAEMKALTETSQAVIAEYVLYLHKDGQLIDLPIATILKRDGDQVQNIRLYHSTWPLTGKHIIRNPLLSPMCGLEEPEIVEQYMAALSKGDEAAVLATFEPDGYVREPSGSRYRHSGPDGRKAFYDLALASGGISLKHCSATFDGKRFAVEYICDEWGKVRIPPQAGMAVYELGDSGRILAVRIYDDVLPPFEKH